MDCHLISHIKYTTKSINIQPQCDLPDIIKIHSYSIKIENYIFQHKKMKHPKTKILSF